MAASSTPFDDIRQFFQRMSDEFDDVARSYGSDIGTALPMDVADHDAEFVVTVDIPGYDREEIDVEVTDHTLHVHADREVEHDTASETYLRRERRQQTLDRSVRLPEAVDGDTAMATLRNGILTITLPKTEPTRSHKHIDIE